MKLVTEIWQGEVNSEAINEEPDFRELSQALCALDGKVSTLMFVERQSDVSLQVGGGPDSYICQILNGDSVWLANGSTGIEGPLNLVVGGQLSEFDGRAKLTYQEARDILSVFFHGDGVLTTTVTWEAIV